MIKEKGRCPICNRKYYPNKIPMLIQTQRMTNKGIQVFHKETISYICDFCEIKWTETNELFPHYIK